MRGVTIWVNMLEDGAVKADLRAWIINLDDASPPLSLTHVRALRRLFDKLERSDKQATLSQDERPFSRTPNTTGQKYALTRMRLVCGSWHCSNGSSLSPTASNQHNQQSLKVPGNS